MPASARLLQKLKEAWGDEVTQDLVTWVDEAQTVNRAELREVADGYFKRFAELLDERIASTEAKFETMLEERLALSETRLDAKLNDRIALSEAKFDARLSERLGTLEARLDGGMHALQLETARLEGRLDTGIASLRAEVAAQMRDQMRWMFVFWAGTIVPLAGLIVALGKDWL